MSVLILLATYNGEKFIDRQLSSLQAQSFTNWKLLVRDDGSTDGTRDILEKAAGMDPRVELLPDDGRRLGPASNFAELLAEALARKGDYVALCDQDDTWHERKLEIQLARIGELERQASIPVLVHTDLAVCDKELSTVHPSMMDLQLIRRPGNDCGLSLLVQNHVVGCTILMNRTLLELATPVPEDVHMHDWWLALCAEFVGVRDFIPQSLVYYRQHENNSIGAKGVRGRLSQPLKLRQWLLKMNGIYRSGWKQAAHLASLMCALGSQHKLSPEMEEIRGDIQRLLALRSSTRLNRTWQQMRMDIKRQNVFMTGLYYFQSAILIL